MSNKKLSDKFNDFEIRKKAKKERPIIKTDPIITEVIEESIYKFNSEQLRTAYFLITGKTIRKPKEEIKKELIEILKK